MGDPPLLHLRRRVSDPPSFTTDIDAVLEMLGEISKCRRERSWDSLEIVLAPSVFGSRSISVMPGRGGALPAGVSATWIRGEMNRAEAGEVGNAEGRAGTVDKGSPIRPEDLVDRFQKRIYAVIYRMTGLHTEADDLCQETFVQVFRSLPTYRPGTNLDSWVYRIAMNVAVDHLRRQGKRRKIHEKLRSSGPPLATQAGLPEETVRAVHLALEDLPADQKAVVVLRLFEELSHDQIAGILDVPVTTVRWRLFAALEKLEHTLESHVDGPGDPS